MSKNMTRKGLAFGAGFALVASGLAAAPAQADGISGFVTLAPNSGPAAATAVVAAEGADFALKATPATAVMGGGEIKFKVNDTSAKFLPGAATTGADTAVLTATDTGDDTDFLFANAANETVSLNVTADGVADGTYILYSDLDIILDDDAGTAGAEVTALTANTLREGYVTNGVLTFKSLNDFVDTGLVDIETPAAAAADSNITLTLVPGGNESGEIESTVADNATLTLTVPATSTVTLPVTGIPDGTYFMFSADGDLVSDDGNAGLETDGTHLDHGEVVTAEVDNNVVTFVSTLAGIDDGAASENGDILNAETLAFISTYGTTVRASDNSFVVGSDVTTAGQTAVVDIQATDALTRSVSVEAWVDAFADNAISAVEYQSPATTVQFVAFDDISATATLDAPVTSDIKLTGEIVTSPLINVAENDNDDFVQGVFTRQGSVTNGISSDTSTQNATTGVVTVEVALDTTAAVETWTDANSDGVGTANQTANQNWDKNTGGDPVDNPATQDGSITHVSVSVKDNVATAITNDGAATDGTDTIAHFLRVGDKITFEDVAGTNALIDGEQFTVTSVPTTSSFTFALTADDGVVEAVGADSADAEYTVTTRAADTALVDGVITGDYTMQAALETTSANDYELVGSASAFGTQAEVADDMLFETVASESLQGASVKKAANADTDAKILAGTLSAVATATVLDDDGDAVGAGRSVTFTVTASESTVEVNGKANGKTGSATTDANGQVTFTVTDTVGADGTTVTINATPEGVSSAATDFTFEWDKAAFTLYDLNTTQGALANDNRYIEEGASYDMNLLLADQFFTPAPSDTYRLAVSGSGVTEGFVTLTDGKATVSVADNLNAEFKHKVTVQKATAGVFANTSTSVEITNKVIKSTGAAVKLAADASDLYASATADLSDAVASKALVERDLRQAFVAQPSYTSSSGGAVVVTGKVTKATSGASLTDAVVTISGSSNILFSDGDVDARGGLTLVADNNGEFSVTLYSTTAQTDSVITVTSVGVEATTKVSFTGQGVGEGTVLTIDTPANVAPAGTFQVKANLADAFGNGVDTSADRMKVTYTGPGIYFGTLPTQTDANGDLTFSVLLGANDTGTITVTVSYDQNGDKDFVDTKDLTTTKTITVGDAPADTKVNAGSFKGYVAVYAKGYEGQRLSAKIGNDWVIVPSIPAATNDLYRLTDFTGAGVDIAVRIYIDRVLIDTINLTTK